jgi:hypothetical protein
MTCGRTKLIGLKNDQRALRLLSPLQVIHAFLNSSDETEHKQRNCGSAHGQNRA